MSSLITTLYDAMTARLAAVLTPTAGWTRIPNAYDLSANNDQMLKSGWGLAMGPAANTNLQMGGFKTQERTFKVVISAELAKTDHDVTGIGDVQKYILEALALVITDFEKTTTLNTGQGFCAYRGDEGISFVSGSDSGFLAVTANFTVQLLEQL